MTNQKSQTLVLGMGISGKSAADLLKKMGKEVVVYDDRFSKDPAFLAACKDYMTVTEVLYDRLEQIIASPGVPHTHPVMAAAIERGVPIIGEVELALRQSKIPVIGITGTNGKTTVTELVTWVLLSAGKNGHAIGNIGEPTSRFFASEPKEGIAVVELSSYQIETLITQTIDVGVILNITPDHLDRYGSMRAYAAAKCKLATHLKSGPLFVSDSVMREYGDLLEGAHVAPLEKLPILGAAHDIENARAAYSLCKYFGVSQQEFLDAFAKFKKAPHRIEYVGEVNGVSFYNDSKGTNVDAVLKAVDAVDGPVVLIAGGVAKGCDFGEWKTGFEGKVKRVIAIGQAQDVIIRALDSILPVDRATTLREAVEVAYLHADHKGTVLLSPGCASFDMFQSYIDRGEKFTQIALELIETKRKEK